MGRAGRIRLASIVTLVVVAALFVPAGASAQPAPSVARPISVAGSPDAYEPDGTTATAKPIDGGVHTFTDTGGATRDVDWSYFDAVQGHTYQITSSAYDRGSNEVWIVPVEIRDGTGTRILAYQNWFDRWFSAYWGTLARVAWTAPATGRYFVRTADVAVYDNSYSPDPFLQYTLSIDDTAPGTAGSVERIDGADRYEVAAKVAKGTDGTYAGVTNIIIASGLDAAMADALSAAGLAGALDAPVLLARGDRAYLPAPTKTAIQACAAANPGVAIHFHIVGGPASVPVVLEKQLKSAAGGSATVERISGADRYAVAANVAAHIRAHVGADYNQNAFFVNGQNPSCFADALAAAPEAAGQGSPILLVKSTVVPAATAAQFRYYGWRYVVGAPNTAIKSATYSAIAHGSTSTQWLDGTSRDNIARTFGEYWEHGYETEWYGQPLTRHYVVANKLSDALTAGCAPSLRWSFVLYVNATTDSRGLLPDGTEQFLASRRGYAPTITIVGGTSSVGPGVQSRLDYLVGNTAP